jgi:2,4-dienoyl-CoA reductase-like NADH-dependent reductase (Old Yellow Enzyme family)
MANTPTKAMRIPAELVEAARARVGADLSVSVLVRAGLATLAGHSVGDALAVAQQMHPGGYRPQAESRAAG